MEVTEIAARLKAYLESEFPNDGAELSLTTSLLDDWFIDSLAIVQTVLFLESAFGISLGRADINAETFKTIASLSEFIAGRLEKG